MLDNLGKLVKNKTFWLMVVALLILTIKTLVPTLPVSDDMIEKVFFLAITLIFGVNFADVASAMRLQSKTTLDLQKMHQKDMETLYTKFNK
jgi:hypothetical protein